MFGERCQFYLALGFCRWGEEAEASSRDASGTHWGCGGGGVGGCGGRGRGCLVEILWIECVRSKYETGGVTLLLFCLYMKRHRGPKREEEGGSESLAGKYLTSRLQVNPSVWILWCFACLWRLILFVASVFRSLSPLHGCSYPVFWDFLKNILFWKNFSFKFIQRILAAAPPNVFCFCVFFHLIFIVLCFGFLKEYPILRKLFSPQPGPEGSGYCALLYFHFLCLIFWFHFFVVFLLLYFFVFLYLCHFVFL